VSFQVYCNTQEEINYYSDRLIADGGNEGQCGWLKDKFGLSWQINPPEMAKYLNGPPEKAGRAFHAMLGMKRLDIGKLRAAFEGK
jgi:predicted 3-demethylubiquinone-9 3-methyltransferase (glyoxalase superfamily)